MTLKWCVNEQWVVFVLTEVDLDHGVGAVLQESEVNVT